MPAIGRRGPAEFVDILVRAAVIDVLREFALESVASGISDGGHRRTGDRREVAPGMPMPSAVPPKFVNRSRWGHTARSDIDDVLRRLPRKAVGGGRADA